MTKKTSDKLKLAKVEFVPTPDSDGRLRRIFEVLLRTPDEKQDEVCEDGEQPLQDF